MKTGGTIMAALVNGNIILIFFFAMLAIYNYINLKEYQRIILNHICLFDYLFISSQMSAKPYFIGSTGILLLW